MIAQPTQPALAAGRIVPDPARRTSRRHRRRRGVSLIELVLVTVIIATVSTIATPRYLNALHRYRCAAAADRIVADLALAQRAARIGGASQTVTFDVAREAYDIPGVDHPLRRAVPYSVILAESPYRAALQAADFEGSSAINFDGYGMPDSGGVVIVRCGDFERHVAVDAATGRAWVQ